MMEAILYLKTCVLEPRIGLSKKSHSQHFLLQYLTRRRKITCVRSVLSTLRTDSFFLVITVSVQSVCLIGGADRC